MLSDLAPEPSNLCGQGLTRGAEPIEITCMIMQGDLGRFVLSKVGESTMSVCEIRDGRVHNGRFATWSARGSSSCSVHKMEATEPERDIVTVTGSGLNHAGAQGRIMSSAAPTNTGDSDGLRLCQEREAHWKNNTYMLIIGHKTS